MRILLLNYEYPPLGGGAGVATAALAHGLVQRGVTVDVVTAWTGASGPEPSSDKEGGGGPNLYWVKTRRQGIHQAGMASAGGFLLGAVPIIRRLVHSRRYDLAHFFFSLPTGALLPFAGWAGIPTVVSLRGSDVPGYDRSNRALQAAHHLLRPVTRWIWRRADRMVAVCENLGELARHTQPGLRFDVIRNGVDLELFRPPDDRRPTRLDGIRCIAVARLIERKGLAHLLHAWSLLERGRYRLEIIGDGPEEGRLRAVAADLGIDGEVYFAGALDRTPLAERYRQADLFTLTPSDEAFGNVFAEALACGLPIVGSNIGGIPELVRHGENGLLVSPGDPGELAGAIRRLADNRMLRRAMGIRNRAKAEATLSWDYATDCYLELYHELTAVPVASRQPAEVLALRA